MYRLYYSPGTASLAVHWMLVELGVPFELELVDFASNAQRSAEYLAVNPTGRVPALVVDGKAYGEVAALLMLLAERHPDAGLAPPQGSAGRPEYLQWMVYLANTMQPAFRAWYYPDEPAGPDNAGIARAQASAAIEAGWTRIDALLADGRRFLLGETMSAADFLAAMLTRWSRNLPRPATDWPNLSAYVVRMRTRPGLREVHRREGLTDWIEG
jgi:glutathione S-transferase